MRNYYKVLGISETASQDEIREAYRKLVKMWHPDRNPHDPMLQEMMKLYNAAYEALSNPITRHHHDVSLGLRSAKVHERPLQNDSDYQSTSVSSGIKLENNNSYNSWSYEQYAFPTSCNLRLGGICLLIGIVSLIYYAFQVHHIRTAPQWPTVEGSITELQATVGGRGATFHPCLIRATVYYRHTVDNKEYNGSEFLSCESSEADFRKRRNNFRSKYSKEPLIIHYDPDNPQRSLIDLQRAVDSPSSFVSTGPLLIAAFGFGIGLYLFLDFLDRKIINSRRQKKVAGNLR